MNENGDDRKIGQYGVAEHSPSRVIAVVERAYDFIESVSNGNNGEVIDEQRVGRYFSKDFEVYSNGECIVENLSLMTRHLNALRLEENIYHYRRPFDEIVVSYDLERCTVRCHITVKEKGGNKKEGVMMALWRVGPDDLLSRVDEMGFVVSPASVGDESESAWRSEFSENSEFSETDNTLEDRELPEVYSREAAKTVTEQSTEGKKTKDRKHEEDDIEAGEESIDDDGDYDRDDTSYNEDDDAAYGEDDVTHAQNDIAEEDIQANLIESVPTFITSVYQYIESVLSSGENLAHEDISACFMPDFSMKLNGVIVAQGYEGLLEHFNKAKKTGHVYKLPPFEETVVAADGAKCAVSYTVPAGEAEKKGVPREKALVMAIFYLSGDGRLARLDKVVHTNTET